MESSGVTRSELQRRGRRVVRKGGKQVLLVASGERIFAVANRCPHEGYPLSEGTLGPACVLTCDWHNWKFDLTSGEALVGRDPVRTYPVRLEDGEILVDLADAPAEQRRRRALAGLDVAMADNDRTRMAPEGARLGRAGPRPAAGGRPARRRHDPRPRRRRRLAGAQRPRAVARDAPRGAAGADR